MGSGRAHYELTHSAKKPREKRRRIKTQKNRLIQLGVPQEIIDKASVKKIREMLKKPKQTEKQFSANAEK
jgi:hypothetical protein